MISFRMLLAEIETVSDTPLSNKIWHWSITKNLYKPMCFPFVNGYIDGWETTCYFINAFDNCP